MIDRENKRIINGFGTIIVTSNAGYPKIWISHVEPPQTIGETPEGKYDTLDKEEFTIDYYDMIRIKKDLLNIDSSNTSMNFIDGWILDFSEYNPRSIKTYLNSISTMEEFYQPTLAC